MSANDRDPKEKVYNILITGCNGYIGRLCYAALQTNKSFRVVLTDRIVGFDAHNRFGAEQVDNHNHSSIPEFDIHVIDLVHEKAQLAQLFQDYNIDVVIHLASVLENGTLDAISNNDLINGNVLDLCNQFNCHCIAASSIRTFYGNCAVHPIVSQIFRRNATIECPANERFDHETVLCNNEETVKFFTKQGWQEALAYVKSKERLEALCEQISSSNKSIALIPVRFGWCSVKSPHDIERETSTDDSCTQTSVILHPDDLQTFIQKLVQCIINGSIRGFHVFTCISEGRQRWVSLDREETELHWKPQGLS